MTDPLFDISGKIALVTGGTSGIGHMIARGLVARGRADLCERGAIPGRRRRSPRKSRRRRVAPVSALPPISPIRPGRRFSPMPFAAKESRLDLLVNNAGANATGSLAAMGVGGLGHGAGRQRPRAFFLTKALLPLLKAGADPARLVNIGSIGGLHVPAWEAHAYGASKAAIHHLTRSLAKALGPDRITVNAIAPGPFPSRMTDLDSEQLKKSVATYIPLGRPGEADDVVGAGDIPWPREPGLM